MVLYDAQKQFKQRTEGVERRSTLNLSTLNKKLFPLGIDKQPETPVDGLDSPDIDKYFDED